MIVNLQKTPKDKQAAMTMHARCDHVLAGVMRHLRRPILAFVRTDTVVVRHEQSRPLAGHESPLVHVRVELGSVHGPRCPLPMVAAAELSFPVSLSHPVAFCLSVITMLPALIIWIQHACAVSLLVVRMALA